MKNLHRKIRALAAAGVTVALFGATVSAQAATAADKPTGGSGSPRSAELPADVQKTLKDFKAVTPGEGFVPASAYLVTKGTQTYTCTAGKWSTTSTPEATLTRLLRPNDRIHHFGGPRWKSINDGSIIKGKQRIPPVAVPQSGTIPWLLLDVDLHEGEIGSLTPVTNISRILTSGGVPPAGTCTNTDKNSFPYKAVYVFWVKKP
jgi:hypothetical protein